MSRVTTFHSPPNVPWEPPECDVPNPPSRLGVPEPVTPGWKWLLAWFRR